MSRGLKIFILLITLGGLSIVPSFASGYHLRFLTVIFMWVGLVSCWNIVAGYTGYIDLGPVAYYGLGAYTTGVLMLRAGWPFAPSLILSGIVPALISIPVGIPTMRLRGAYFAIATLAFAEAMREIVLQWDVVTKMELTGGSYGLNLPIGPGFEYFYYLMLGVMLAVLSTTYWIDRSKFGYGLRAIREAEQAAQVIGVNTLRLKLMAYMISAFYLGLIGGIWAYWHTFIEPTDVFSILKTIQMVVMALLGGMGTVFGPLVGAAFLSIVSEILWAKFIYTYMLMVGLIIVIVMFFMPRGIAGFIKGLPR